MSSDDDDDDVSEFSENSPNEKSKKYQKTNDFTSLRGIENLGNVDIPGTQCDICMKIFTKPDRLTAHRKKSHPELGLYKCEETTECIFETYNEKNYLTHLDDHMNVKKVKCDFCNSLHSQGWEKITLVLLSWSIFWSSF